MLRPTISNDPAAESWREALSAAVGGVTDSGRAIQLFYEQRRDTRLEFWTDRGWATTRSRTRGLAADDIVDRRVHVYRAAPAPADAAVLARAAAGLGELPAGGAVRPVGEDDGPSIAAQERIARDAIDRIARVTAGILPSARLSARAVTSGQQVSIARPIEGFLSDLRIAVRLRVTASYRRGGTEAAAVVETALHRRAAGFKTEALDRLGIELARRVERRLESRAIPSGRHAVVLAPGVGGLLIHEVVGHALEADVGCSWLSGVRGPVAPADITVVDDPRVGRAAWRTDDEGVECRPTPLIRAGRVAGRLHDRATARREGVTPTGHGRRSSYREPVLPRMGCTFIASGRDDPREVIGAAGTGVYVHRMEAANVDPETSQAIFRVTDADRIVSGRIAGPLDPFAMVVNGRETLANVSSVGRDLAFDTCIGSCHREGQALSISVGSPTICIGVVGVMG